MLKAGIFLDIENLVRCGGWGIRYGAVRALVEHQGAVIVRANAYMAIDTEREEWDPEYRQKKQDYRDAVRREGYHVVLKEVQRFKNAEGETVTKANADMDLAVDALQQLENLDYVLLGTGDSDFIRLVRSMQSRGRRVDLLSFSNTSRQLRHEVDHYFSGYLVPGVLPNRGDNQRERGVLHVVYEDKGFAFMSMRTGLNLYDVREDVFCHITDFQHRDGRPVTNNSFARLKKNQVVLEFDLVEQEDGKVKAVNVTELADS